MKQKNQKMKYKNYLSSGKQVQNSYGKFNEFSKQKIIVTHKVYNSRSLSPKVRTKQFQSDPFAVAAKHKTNFGYVYSAGGIPCRLDFNGSKMRLKWDIQPSDLNYDPILDICFEGILETEHPYRFVSRECIKEMLAAENAYEKVIPMLSKLMIRLRKALESPIEHVFIEAMDVLKILSFLVKEQINKFLFLVLQQINRRSFKLKYKEKVFDLLRDFENNGGNEAYMIIKSKIPTYTTTL